MRGPQKRIGRGIAAPTHRLARRLLLSRDAVQAEVLGKCLKSGGIVPARDGECDLNRGRPPQWPSGPMAAREATTRRPR
jgi:hypothetical protein